MKKKYIQWIKAAMIGAVLLLVCNACSDTWDDHYDQNAGAIENSNKTLWERIKTEQSLQDFAEICVRTGYDRILNSSQTYTVWGPKDGSYNADIIMQMDSATMVLEFVQNHITRYSQVATGAIDYSVYMLNKKVNTFTGGNGEYSFAKKQLVQKNIPAKNGILHIIDNQVEYFPNIWEYLAKESELSDISKFLYAYDRETLDTENSIQGPIINGEITYLDSVMINTNLMMQYIGWLDREDSLYTMIVPTNKAWKSAQEKVSAYFKYYSRNSEYLDSISTINVNKAIIKNLVFNNKEQQNKEDITLSPDSLYTTRKISFYNPYHADLFVESTKNAVSNGYAYVTDSLRYHPWMSYHLPILVETEFSDNYEISNERQLANVMRVTSSNIIDTIAAKGSISNGFYLELPPPSSAASPQVVFKLRNVLSAKYNIKAVIVPANITSTSMTQSDLKPQQMLFRLNYPNQRGTLANIQNSVDYPQKKGYHIDTLTVIENFEFPVCEYDLGSEAETNLLVRLTPQGNNISYDRTIRLDCIILEPVKEDE